MTTGFTSLAAAEQAFGRGDMDGALVLLSGQSDPRARHLRAIVLRRTGRLAEAREAFADAVAASPDDPELLNNFANLLRQLGEGPAAIALYGRALALRPGYRDAAFNKALHHQALGEAREALSLLEDVCAANPQDFRAHSARGTALRELGRHVEAAAAYDRALAIEPRLATALKGRAQVALERGEADAAERCQGALAADPGDFGTIHLYAEALEAAGRPEATDMLEKVLAIQPDWIDGYVFLARLKAEQGEEDFAASMRDAVAQQPDNHALATALARVLAAAERWDDALRVLPAEGEHATMRAHLTSEGGDPGSALKLLEGGATGTPALIVAGRAHLRLGDPAAAAKALEQAVAADPGAIGAWGLLEIAWRLTGDARSAWLSGQPGLFGVHDLDLDPAELEALATVLRGLHRTRAHPIGQSLRGGTQTRGRLFLRGEPELARLHEALSAAVANHLDGLPARDPTHPLLRHRDAAMTIAGSWSVRLTSSGFHVNHIHSEGLLSSACYISLPATMGDDGSRDGWLELGRPPSELGLELDPLATVEPRPGHVALFPSYLFHGTRPFADGERLTVAFDVIAA